MKNLLLSALVLGLALSSCKQEDAIGPDQPSTSAASSNNMREAMSPTIPKLYQLVKHGTSTLNYSEDGRLAKVTYGYTYRGTYPTYKAYTYTANSIISKLYGNNKLQEEITYLLDPNTGNCYESKHKEYTNPNTNQAQVSSYGYYYNIKGQLMMRQNKADVNDYTLLDYDTVWNLVKVSIYGSPGNGGPAKLILESKLSYNQPTGDPLLLDLRPINCEVADLPDTYLRIFGKPTKYLVKLITETGSLGGRYFTYTMNADGYPTSRQMYNVNGGTLGQTIPYDYLVTNMGFNL
jgi:hypothetical protein